jgi:hypothetical protein
MTQPVCASGASVNPTPHQSQVGGYGGGETSTPAATEDAAGADASTGA